MARSSRVRMMIAAVATVLMANNAVASQGPGTSPGTASASTQMTMAIAVYGFCAVAILAGLIGAFRASR